jgi:PAS domain S-box-containing protein
MAEINKILKAYDQKSFVIRLKAQFVLYCYLIVLVAIFAALCYTLYANLNNPIYGYSVNIEILSLFIGAFAFISLGFFFLLRGHYSFAAHLLLMSGTGLVWTVIFVDKTHIVSRLDTITLAIGLLSMLPIIISKKPYAILLYAGANITALFAFIFIFREELNLPKASTISYLSDNIVAILGVAIISYAVYTISRRALDKAELDFAERKKAEEALQISELFKMRVFDNSKIPIVVMNSTTMQFIEFNQAAIEAYGFPTREALLGKTPLDVSAKVQYDGTPSAEKAQVFIKKAITDGAVVFEWKHQRANGECWDAEVHLLSFKANEEIFLQFSLVDITERKKAEIALVRSEEKYRMLMENLNDVIMMVDNDDRVLFVNKKFSEKLGYTAEEIIGKIGYQHLVSSENQDFIKEVNDSRLYKETSQYEMPFIAKDGTTIDFLVSGAPIINSEGTTIGSIGAMIDITDRKKAELALKESEERYRTIIESFPDIIMVSDLEGNILFANKVLEEATGIKPEDYRNPKRKAHIHPDDFPMVRNAIVELLRGSSPSTEIIENRFIDTSGNLHWLSGTISKIFFNRQLCLQTITRDITEKKTSELELQVYRNHLEQLVNERTNELAEANRELQATNHDLLLKQEELEAAMAQLEIAQDQLIQAEKMASMGILAAGIAHEINNPLNYIYNGTAAIENFIRDKYAEEAAGLDPLFEAVNTGVDRVTGIVKSMNRYSRNENLALTYCSIQKVMDQCLLIISNKYKKNIIIVKNYLPENPSVLAHEDQLRQVFLNILDNAFQAIEKEGTITIDLALNHMQLNITITDSGKGISEENLKHVFDPFFTTRNPGEGTGLGLALAKKIMEDHQGTITCVSTLEKGTTFTLGFPISNQQPWIKK